MGAHLIDGEFQSDKYPTTPRGKVPLSVKDPTAQDLLWEYAQRRRAVDAEFSADLETALLSAGYEPTCQQPVTREDGICDENCDGPECNRCHTAAVCGVRLPCPIHGSKVDAVVWERACDYWHRNARQLEGQLRDRRAMYDQVERERNAAREEVTQLGARVAELERPVIANQVLVDQREEARSRELEHRGRADRAEQEVARLRGEIRRESPHRFQELWSALVDAATGPGSGPGTVTYQAAQVLLHHVEWMEEQLLAARAALTAAEADRAKAEQGHKNALATAETWKEMRDAARAQLPDGMKHCTILFKQCEQGHGWLTATNWVQHRCPTCVINDALRDAEQTRAVMEALDPLRNDIIEAGECDAGWERLARAAWPDPKGISTADPIGTAGPERAEGE